MASGATPGKAGREWIWYPLLFAAFPVLTLFNANSAEVAPGEVVRPLLVLLAAAVVLWGLLTLLLRNVRKAALLCAFTLLLFFLYGIVRGLLLGSASPLAVECGRDTVFLLRPWFGVLLLGFVLVLRTRRDLRGWTGPLNAAGAVLVLWPLFGSSTGARSAGDRRAGAGGDPGGGLAEHLLHRPGRLCPRRYAQARVQVR